MMSKDELKQAGYDRPSGIDERTARLYNRRVQHAEMQVSAWLQILNGIDHAGELHPQGTGDPEMNKVLREAYQVCKAMVSKCEKALETAREERVLYFSKQD